jgi:hypothetical protein
MSTPAGWYDDPTRGGRLRYWDGSQWTEWVNEHGQTVSEPIGAPAAPASGTPSQVGGIPAGLATATAQAAEPTPGIQAAPAAGGGWGAAPAAAGVTGAYPTHPTGRIGHFVAAAGGLVALGATGQELTQQVTPLGTITFSASAAVPVTGLVLAAGSLVAAFVPNIWARLAGVLAAAGATVFLLLFMLGTKTADDFLAGQGVEAKLGWWFVSGGALLGLAGTLLAVFLFTRPAAGDDGRTSAPPFGVIGLVMSAVGVLVVPLAAAGAAAGLAGKHDSEASSGRIGGKGLAVAAFWLGLAAFALWTIGLFIGGLVAEP